MILRLNCFISIARWSRARRCSESVSLSCLCFASSLSLELSWFLSCLQLFSCGFGSSGFPSCYLISSFYTCSDSMPVCILFEFYAKFMQIFKLLPSNQFCWLVFFSFSSVSFWFFLLFLHWLWIETIWQRRGHWQFSPFFFLRLFFFKMNRNSKVQFWGRHPALLLNSSSSSNNNSSSSNSSRSSKCTTCKAWVNFNLKETIK